MALKYGFGPVAGDDAAILILGSMPGEASLTRNQYYGHPRNAFWPIVCGILEADPRVAYTERLQLLLDNQIALWDVLKTCEREGSLDASIQVASEEANDLVGFLSQHSQIRTLCFNGQKAFNSFRKHLLKLAPELAESYELITLPSTSPANASVPMDIKVARWTHALAR